jgi:flagellar P-ring protein precursor FlgI
MLTACAASARSRRRPAAAVAAGLLVAALGTSVRAEDGVRTRAPAEEGLVVGVGLVIGLPGTGDSVIDQEVVDASIVGVLRRAGLEPWQDQIKPGRVAAVVLSADLPDRPGEDSRVDVNVAAIGDARSIAGGTLLVAPLRDADGVVHATGQGFIALDASWPDAGRGCPLATGIRASMIADGAVIAVVAGNERRTSAPGYASLMPSMLQD